MASNWTPPSYLAQLPEEARARLTDPYQNPEKEALLYLTSIVGRLEQAMATAAPLEKALTRLVLAIEDLASERADEVQETIARLERKIDRLLPKE